MTYVLLLCALNTFQDFFWPLHPPLSFISLLHHYPLCPWSSLFGSNFTDCNSVIISKWFRREGLNDLIPLKYIYISINRQQSIVEKPLPVMLASDIVHEFMSQLLHLWYNSIMCLGKQQRMTLGLLPPHRKYGTCWLLALTQSSPSCSDLRDMNQQMDILMSPSLPLSLSGTLFT